MPANNQNGNANAKQWLESVWPAAFAQGLEAMLGAKVEFSCLPIEASAPANSGKDSWWVTEFSGLAGAVLTIGCPSEVADRIGRSALTAVGVSDASAEDAKGTYQEIVGQSLSTIAQGLSRELKKDIACVNGRVCQHPTDTTFVLPLKLIYSLEECGPIWLAVGPKFDSVFSAPAAAKADQDKADAPGPAKTMDLLFDVELPLSVSFGRTQLALKDVIKLTTGSIVELNRSISEPVEVIVNNCVIARGEVVVIEGNYGVRIQQIISRQERLRTLH